MGLKFVIPESNDSRQDVVALPSAIELVVAKHIMKKRKGGKRN